MLRSLNEQLLTVPEGFTIHPKLLPQLERRREAHRAPRAASPGRTPRRSPSRSLLTEGVPVRLTGQDTTRGTFSQRHLELHDMGEGETWTPHTGRVYTPMANLLRASASLELHNSPLSEAAAVGFEYGYSTQAPEALVLWEAQYGDFANGAQIMIDQFIVSGRAKWGERSRLTLLLPHGYEGNGPEHSSARIERFLQLAAEDNIRVANCSTAANYFHLLRKQALTDLQRPLIIFTPKSLLRVEGGRVAPGGPLRGPLPRGHRGPAHREPPGARSPGSSCARGRSSTRWTRAPSATRTRSWRSPGSRCSSPSPRTGCASCSRSTRTWSGWSGCRRSRATWARGTTSGSRSSASGPEGIPLEYCGRARRASPSEGYPQAHQAEQERVLAAALGGETREGR